MHTEEDTKRVAEDPFARGLEDYMTKHGKEAYVILGMGGGEPGFTMVKGTGYHAISLLLSFAVEYPDVFQHFMTVFTQIALEAGKDTAFLESFMESKEKKESPPAVMGEVKF